MCEFVIRPPEEKDIPALRDLYLETRKSTFDWLHSKTMALQDCCNMVNDAKFPRL